eukprot:PRCOL_00002573-RA
MAAAAVAARFGAGAPAPIPKYGDEREEDLLTVCEGLGHFDRDTGEYLLEEDTLECLQDVQRMLRRDDPQRRPTYRLCAELQVLKKHIVPLMTLHGHEPKMLLAALKVAVFLTLPLDDVVERRRVHAADLQACKAAFLDDRDADQSTLSAIVDFVLDPLMNIQRGHQTDNDVAVIELVLTLVRNLLAIADPDANSHRAAGADHMSRLADELLTVLFDENVMSLLLSIAAMPVFQSRSLLLLEIIHYALKGQRAKAVFEAGLRRRSKRADPGKAAAEHGSSLAATLRAEKERLRTASRGVEQSRHSRFGGTLKRKDKYGKAQHINPWRSAKPAVDAGVLLDAPKPKVASVHSKAIKAMRATSAHVDKEAAAQGSRDASVLRKLRQWADDMLSGPYNDIIAITKRAIAAGSREVLESDGRHLMSVARFFCEYQLLWIEHGVGEVSKASAEAKEAGLDKEARGRARVEAHRKLPALGRSFGALSATIDESMFKLANRKWLESLPADMVKGEMSEFVSTKEGDLRTASAAMGLIKQMLHVLDATARVGSHDEKLVANTLQLKLFHDATDVGLLPALRVCTRTFDRYKHPRSLMVDMVEATHVTLRMLEAMTQKHGSVYVLKTKRQRVPNKAKAAAVVAPEDFVVGDGEGEEPPQVATTAAIHFAARWALSRVPGVGREGIEAAQEGGVLEGAFMRLGEREAPDVEVRRVLQEEIDHLWARDAADSDETYALRIAVRRVLFAVTEETVQEVSIKSVRSEVEALGLPEGEDKTLKKICKEECAAFVARVDEGDGDGMQIDPPHEASPGADPMEIAKLALPPTLGDWVEPGPDDASLKLSLAEDDGYELADVNFPFDGLGLDFEEKAAEASPAATSAPGPGADAEERPAAEGGEPAATDASEGAAAEPPAAGAPIEPRADETPAAAGEPAVEGEGDGAPPAPADQTAAADGVGAEGDGARPGLQDAAGGGNLVADGGHAEGPGAHGAGGAEAEGGAAEATPEEKAKGKRAGRKGMIVRKHEVAMDLKHEVAAFGHVRVFANYCFLLEGYATNDPALNHAAVKMLSRLSQDCGLEAYLFQLSVLGLFYRVLSDKNLSGPKARRDQQELRHFAAQVTRHYVRKLKGPLGNLLLVDTLFWKTPHEVDLIDNDYQLPEERPGPRGKGRRGRRKGGDALGDDDVDEYVGGGAGVLADGDDIAAIMAGDSDEEGRRAPRAPKSRLWTAEGDAKLAELWEELRAQPHATRRMASELNAAAVHPKAHLSSAEYNPNQVSQRLVQLGLRQKGERTGRAAQRRKDRAQERREGAAALADASSEDDEPSEGVDGDAPAPEAAFPDCEGAAAAARVLAIYGERWSGLSASDALAMVRARIDAATELTEEEGAAEDLALAPVTSDEWKAVEHPGVVELLASLGFAPPGGPQRPFFVLPWSKGADWQQAIAAAVAAAEGAVAEVAAERLEDAPAIAWSPPKRKRAPVDAATDGDSEEEEEVEDEDDAPRLSS